MIDLKKNKQYNLTAEQEQGFPFEVFLGLLLKSTYKRKNGYLVEYHETIEEYIQKSNPNTPKSDNIVYCNENEFLEGEAKNWSQQNKPYGHKTIYEKVLINRLIHSNALLKILFISFISLISKKGLALLKAHNVHVFEIGKVVTYADLPRRGRDSSFFYSIKNRFESFIDNILSDLGKKAKRFFGVSILDNKLDRYCNVSNTSNNLTQSVNYINNSDIGTNFTRKNKEKFDFTASYEQYRKDWGKT